MLRTRTLSILLVGTLAVAYTHRTARAEDVTTISGKVMFKGDPAKFKRQKINTQKDPNCAKSKAKIGTEKVIINKKTDPMTLRNVLVSIKEGLGDHAFPVPTEPVVLTQNGCQYKPHVLGLVEGQALKILNGDDTNHNIHFLPKVNDETNFTQPKKDLEKGRVLKLVAEAPFKVKCDVHPWMGCRIGVFKHPFFNVTGKDGTFTLKGMPAGKYVLQAWHEEFGTKTIEVEVTTGEAKMVDFTYEPGS